MIPPRSLPKPSSIEIDPTRAPTPAGTRPRCTPRRKRWLRLNPVSLLNSANGRFAVDRDIGVVTLADDSLLQSERNAVHDVTLRVVEPSGATYELEMRLRITGHVPQMVGAEEFAAIAGLTDETILIAQRVPVLVVPQETPVAPAVTTAPWTRFSAAQGHSSRAPRVQPRRSFIGVEVPAISEPVSMEFDGLPQPFSAHLPWSL